ncbi:MAG: hypothetical protein AVDCRST_MAG74-1385 [uncultured Pyrinomonadaceae bacterium]|uniref:Uncharacterized protein n=1 Tax=uncultured Pyrinomonadaceae bacterium TaxID=2283094 RepID=A0A6J4NUY2_9BACT|nr:MAG: hypothetical protein AVDCRST_MAG74-1385 [uncultured Pyrinomonadaceae bacterium]
MSQAKIKLRFAKIKTTLTEAAKTNFLPRKISLAAVWLRGNGFPLVRF